MPSWKIQCECGESFRFTQVGSRGRYTVPMPLRLCEEQERRRRTGADLIQDAVSECPKMGAAFERITGKKPPR